MKKCFLRTLLIGSLAVGLLLPVAAQDQSMPMSNMDQGMMNMGDSPMGMGRGNMGMGPGMMGCGMRGGMMGMGGNMASHIDGRMAFIKAELAITDAQKTVWDEFEKTMRDHFTKMRGFRQSMHEMMMSNPENPPSLTERLDRRISMMETHLNELKTVSAAVNKLYQSLDDNQKSKADQVVMSMSCMM